MRTCLGQDTEIFRVRGLKSTPVPCELLFIIHAFLPPAGAAAGVIRDRRPGLLPVRSCRLFSDRVRRARSHPKISGRGRGFYCNIF